MFSSLKNYLPQTRLAAWYFISFFFFIIFSNNFSLLVTLLLIIIGKKPKKADCYNVNKQKDALKKNGITVDGVHYAVRFKGKFHIIINKVFFSTIIFNPNACMHIDLFLKFISTVILDLKALYFLLEQIGKANLKLGKQGTEVECCVICKALRVCGYIQNL